MREICSYGSVGEPVGNHRLYPETLNDEMPGTERDRHGGPYLLDAHWIAACSPKIFMRSK
jgi:hypothetical protein